MTKLDSCKYRKHIQLWQSTFPSLVLLVLLPLKSTAQPPSFKVGQEVITKYPTSLRVGAQVVEDGGKFRVYRVEQVNGDWLLIVEGSVSGWAKSNDVVPLDQAIDFYTHEIRRNQVSTVAYMRRGVIWGMKGETDIAIADFSESIRLNPNNVTAYLYRGNTWRGKTKHEPDKAISDYDMAIRLDPKLEAAYYGRGIAWRMKREYDKAIADWNDAIRLDPNFQWAFHRRAWLWATCPDPKYRDGKKAISSATRACELSEWHSDTFLGALAAAYAEAGDFEKAVEWQEKANKLYLNDEEKKKGEERLKLFQEKRPYWDEG
jgi:tetratricopeptide (TPR) repeat protein